MKKQNHKSPDVKVSAQKNSPPKTVTPKKAKALHHHSSTEEDEDDLVHKKTSEDQDRMTERDMDDKVHDKLDYLPEAENDNEYFDDENLDDLVSDR